MTTWPPITHQDVQDVVAGIRDLSDTTHAAALNAAYASVVSPGLANGTNDTAALQAALNSGAGKIVKGVPGQSYKINAPLIIKSGTVLDMTGATITLLAGSNCNMLQNYSAGTPQRTVTDAAMTASSTTLTSATAAFTSADVGRSVNVVGAVNATSPLTATITAVTNGTTVTLSKGAVVTVSGATAYLYDRDRDITLRGGTWDRLNNGSGATNRDLHSIVLRRIDRLRVDGLRGLSTFGKFFLNPGDVTDVHITDITLNVSSDGVHVQGPARNVHVADVYGTTGDDSVALITNDWTGYNDVGGDITDALVENVYTTSVAANIAACCGGIGTLLDKIHFRNIGGVTSQSVTKAVQGLESPNTTGGTYGDFVFENVHGTTLGTASLVTLGMPSPRSVTVRDCHWDQTTGYSGVGVAGTGQMQRLVIDGLHIKGSATNKFAVRITSPVSEVDVIGLTYLDSAGGGSTAGVILTANVESLVVDRANVQWSGTGPSLVYCNGGRPLWLFVKNLKSWAGGSVLKMDSNTGSIVASFRDCRVSNAQSLVGVAGASANLDCTISGLTLESLSNAVFDVTNSMTLTVRGGEYYPKTATTLVSRSSTQAVRVVGPTLPVDVSILTPTDGDLAFNTNGALGCGTGPAVYQATAGKWKGLYSGATN
jgi:hypothetical protein